MWVILITVHGTVAIIGIKLGTRHVIHQKLAILGRKRISMLTGLKVSSLACKCVFYSPEHNGRPYRGHKEDPMELNFDGLEMQK